LRDLFGVTVEVSEYIALLDRITARDQQRFQPIGCNATAEMVDFADGFYPPERHNTRWASRIIRSICGRVPGANEFGGHCRKKSNPATCQAQQNQGEQDAVQFQPSQQNPSYLLASGQ
jgi:hypothetical protein